MTGMREVTLRQIEVLRAVMMTGTIKGAAELLNVSAPGISRLVSHLEQSLDLRLFERKAGVFVPAVEALGIFEMIHQVYRQVENLNTSLSALSKGADVHLSFASAPSIAQFIAGRAIRQVRARYPRLVIDLNILKIEETADYLLLEKGEFVAMSSAIANPALGNEAFAAGRLVVIVPDDHALAAKSEISIRDLTGEPIVSVDPADPYGAILARPFRDAGIEPRRMVYGRFAQTVVSLVRNGLGVALIDEFSVAEAGMPGIAVRPLTEEVPITAYIITKKGRQLSSFARFAMAALRRELELVTRFNARGAPRD
jgi:DNA-binding transcriptional LysR family regulator